VTSPIAVYIGHDARETAAYGACCRSLRHHSENAVTQPVSRHTLGTAYRRPVMRDPDGRLWDVISDAPMATDFSLARFWVPLIHRAQHGGGWAVFCDGDFLWRRPIERLLAHADPAYAVMVVQHPQPTIEQGSGQKMDGQIQTRYWRKNWSSLILFNTDHPTVKWAGPALLNTSRGLALHQFAWVPDDQIGALPAEWNWLEGISMPCDNPAAVHFTRGTPDMPGYETSAFADEWRGYARGPAD
jgi:hypothetical protein